MVHRIGIIEGDGVGPEVISWGKSVLEAASRLGGLEFEFVNAPVGGTTFLETGQVLPTLRRINAKYVWQKAK